MTQENANQNTKANGYKKGFTHHNLTVKNVKTQIDNGEKLFVTAFASRPRREVDGEPRKGTAFKIRANGKFARKLLDMMAAQGVNQDGAIQANLNVYGVYEDADEYNGKKTDVVTLFDIYDPAVRAAEKAAEEAAKNAEQDTMAEAGGF